MTTKESTRRGDGYDAGDVVYETWGYDQTNVDFYRIVRRSEADTVWLRKMSARHVPDSDGFMSDRVVPGDDLADAPLIRRRLKRWGPDNAVHGLQVNGFGWCSAWDRWDSDAPFRGTYRSWYA